jgi:hypothetical protein
MRARALAWSIICALALALTGVARATPPVPLDVAGFSLTIDAPDTFVAGVPITVAGHLLAYAHLPIVFEAAQPARDQDIAIYVDGIFSKSARTDTTGSYSVALVFGAEPTSHAIRAIAFEGLPIETSSRTVSTRLERIVVSFSVSPQSLTLQVGETSQLYAIAEYDDGRRADVTARAHWSSSDPSVEVSDAAASKGAITGAAAGSATATATLDDLNASANVSVEPIEAPGRTR